jgi:hypothetical protein
MSRFTDVAYVESSPPDEDRVVDRIFATAHRSPEPPCWRTLQRDPGGALPSVDPQAPAVLVP